MSIDEDAVHVLLALAQYGKRPGDPEQGRYAFEGEELAALTKLDANRLNDSVTLLDENGYLEVTNFMGTHPYDFGEVSLTAQGRREAQVTNLASSVSGASKASGQPPDDSLKRPVDDARFTVGAMLGEGTYGAVWRASDLELKREVAIKFVLAVGEQDALAHARALARVTHPNIVSVYDITTLTNPTSGATSQAVVMELVNGTPLVELIGPAMSREDVGRIGQGLIGALAAYHSAGLAHLDVHDGNVMVAHDDVKVLDPLYYETAWFRSTATRDKQQGRDVRQARDVLVQMLHTGSIQADVALAFERATARPTLELLRSELERALDDRLQRSPPRSAASTAIRPSVDAQRRAVLHATYVQLRKLHQSTLALINLVQVDVSPEAEELRRQNHDSSWNELQVFNLENALYLGARLEKFVAAYMGVVLRAVAGWEAGRRERGNVHDWAKAFHNLQAAGETTLEDISREIRALLGIDEEGQPPS